MDIAIDHCDDLLGCWHFARSAAHRHLPGKPFGPARQEFADCLARLLKEDLECLPTLLLTDLNFPEEAPDIHPMWKVEAA